MKRLIVGLSLMLVFLLIAGCISTNPRITINKNRSVDVIYTSIISSSAIMQTPDLIDNSKNQLKKYGFTVTSREKSNGDQVIRGTKHLADLSELKTQKINDTTKLFAVFNYTIETINGYDVVTISGTMPVLDPPQNEEESTSDQIRTRLTIKAPGESYSEDADIIDGKLFEWEGNDTSPASFTMVLELPLFVPVTKISLNRTNVTVGVGDTFTIIPSLTPINASNKEISYVSQNKNKAKVSKSGVITGVAAGQTTVTVYNSDKTVSKVIQVTVTN